VIANRHSGTIVRLVGSSDPGAKTASGAAARPADPGPVGSAPDPVSWAGSGERVALGLLGAALVVFLWDAWPLQPQLDDAYISYRYAENLVDGLGLVYNPGEYVEGFTNLLWTLCVALGMALGFEATAVGHLLGVASGAATLVAVRVYAGTGLPPSRAWVAAIAPWVLVASASFARWSTSGMETVMFAAWVTAALAAHARARIGWATAFASLATLTRPDGLLVASAILGFHLLDAWRTGWRAWVPALAYAGVLACLTLFRIAYYGSPLPNTFYAKVGDGPFGEHQLLVVSYVARGMAGLLLPALFAIARERAMRPGAVWAAAATVYVLWVAGPLIVLGGEPFENRFLLPVLPCLVALALRGASAAYDVKAYLGILVALCLTVYVARSLFGPLGGVEWAALAFLGVGWSAAVAFSKRILFPATVLLLVGVLAAVPVGGSGSALGALGDAVRESGRGRYLSDARKRDRIFERLGRRRASLLLKRGEPVRLVALAAIGSFGYYARVPVLDILGLVDATIARSHSRGSEVGPRGHLRSNASYVLSRRPDYILIERRPPAGSESASLLPAVRDLHAHPDLERLYRWDEEIGGYRRIAAPGPAPARQDG
jgi:arabinofuranosyltransferase